MRFLSVEPLLEDLGEIDLAGIHWVIVGGESGTGRPADEPGMGRSHPRPVPAAGSLLLQTVGRHAKIYSRPKLEGRTYDEYPQRRSFRFQRGRGVFRSLILS